MNAAEITELLDHLIQRENLGLGLAVLVLFGFFILLLRRQPSQIVAYKSEQGKVLVARSAIRELVQSACEQIEGVSKPKTCIRIKGGRAHFDIRVKLVGTSKLKQIETTLQQHMRRALSENLGIEKLGNINVIATGFKSGRVDQASIKQSAPARNEPEPAAEAAAAKPVTTAAGATVTEPQDEGRKKFF